MGREVGGGFMFGNACKKKKNKHKINVINKNKKQKNKKLQCGMTSHRSEWPSSRSLQIINAGEGVEKRESLDTYW